MCDTLVALGSATADGSVILAKNSDRSPNEAQYPMYVPRTKHDQPTVRCTYIEIPQVHETYAVLLSRPFWLWGCEMGANEFGVTIGNEAVFTKEPLAKTGLLGMDLIRLALERANSARSALDVIAELLAEHGQGGACDIFHPGFSYHNSFIIADPQEAWVLETAGQYWAAVQVTDVYSISNGLTIGSSFDLASPGIVEHAVEKGWCKGEADFDFARCYSDFFYTRIATSCRPRQQRTSAQLQANRGKISVDAMFAYLRDHGPAADDAAWTPARGRKAVCMHTVNSLLRRDQSAASLVAHLRADMPVYWMTGTSAPCTGIFKPFYVMPTPSGIGEPDGEYDPETQWWRHERLHRAVLQDYGARLPVYRDERDELEAAFLQEEKKLYEQHRNTPGDPRESALAEFSARCLSRADEATAEWTEQVTAVPVQQRPGLLYRSYWKKQNQAAQIAIE